MDFFTLQNLYFDFILVWEHCENHKTRELFQGLAIWYLIIF